MITERLKSNRLCHDRVFTKPIISRKTALLDSVSYQHNHPDSFNEDMRDEKNEDALVAGNVAN